MKWRGGGRAGICEGRGECKGAEVDEKKSIFSLAVEKQKKSRK